MAENQQAARETPEERKAARDRAAASLALLGGMDLPTRDFVRLLRKALQTLVADEAPEAQAALVVG